MSLVTSPILLITLNYIIIFLYKGYHLVGGHRPAYALGKHLSVCTSSVLNLRWPSIPKSTVCFSLAKQGMTIPTDQPNILLFGLCCIAVFCFYSFPMVTFSFSQSNRRLTINQCILLLQHHTLAPWRAGGAGGTPAPGLWQRGELKESNSVGSAHCPQASPPKGLMSESWVV